MTFPELRALGYTPGACGLVLEFRQQGWPTLLLHPNGLWSVAGYRVDTRQTDPLEALLTCLGEDYDLFTDSLDAARRNIERIEAMAVDVKAAQRGRQ